VDERLAAFLGHLFGAGRLRLGRNRIALTTRELEQAEAFAGLVRELFGVEPDLTEMDGRYSVRFASRKVGALLNQLGQSEQEADIPDVILRSPRFVVAAFLQAWYDGVGAVGPEGVHLSMKGSERSKTLQLLLLNFGILSTRRRQDERWLVEVTGPSAALFAREVGFGVPRKQAALLTYLQQEGGAVAECWADEVVSIEHGRGDVYDVSVEGSHRYVAQGFVNHNSYWHSTIMTQKALTPAEVIDFADHHSGTMAVSRARINPYKLGIELLRDIEDRWNTGRFGKEYEECDDLEKKRNWNTGLGLGRQKIFEVRRIHNDITFIDTFLTPEFVSRQKMFSYAFQEQAGQYMIESREFEKIKQRLLFSLTNFGRPWIYVVDGNYRNRGELLLRHLHNGIDLRQDLAAEVLANIQFIWSRPVHLHTLADGKPTMLSHDGAEHSIKTGGDIDDPRKHAPGKTK